MDELNVKADVGNLNDVLGFIDSILEDKGCSLKAQMQIDIAVEEIFVNIANYAYAPEVGDAVIRLSVENDEAEITFIDSGVPYDPLEKDDPDVSLSAEERQIGGLGIFMVKKSMDSLAYRYENGNNIFTIKKKII